MTEEQIALLTLAGWTKCVWCGRLHDPLDLGRGVNGQECRGCWMVAVSKGGCEEWCDHSKHD